MPLCFLRQNGLGFAFGLEKTILGVFFATDLYSNSPGTTFKLALMLQTHTTF